VSGGLWRGERVDRGAGMVLGLCWCFLAACACTPQCVFVQCRVAGVQQRLLMGLGVGACWQGLVMAGCGGCWVGEGCLWQRAAWQLHRRCRGGCSRCVQQQSG
jgi:hypothetical protein